MITKEFKSPAKRHSIRSVSQKSVAKNKNTVIEAGVNVSDDVAKIDAGEAQKIGDKFIINGRIYGSHNGTLYPISGPGFHTLDRGAYKALGVFNKFGNSQQAKNILKNMKIGNEQIQDALDVWGIGQ